MARSTAMLVATVLTLVACGTVPAQGPGETATSAGAADNVTGTIERPPLPTCPSDEPCDPHLVAYRLVFSAPGRPDVSVRVRGDGTFSLHLDPGVYSIAAEPPSLRGGLEPSRVTVPNTGTVFVQLRFVRP